MQRDENRLKVKQIIVDITMKTKVETEKKILIPTVKWHQSREYLFLNFDVHNGTNDYIKISENEIIFSIYSKDNYYEMNLELFENIVSEDSSYKIEEKCIRFILKKTNENKWDFITKDRNIYKNNIKINWTEWNDDDSEGEADNSQFDFQQMMQSMGGMGDMSQMMQGMGGMGGMENNGDEDDEDNEDNFEESELDSALQNNEHEHDCECCEDSA